MRKFLSLILLSSIALLGSSCQQHDQKSILIIAADELTTGDIHCSNEVEERSGYQLICNESIRFTHAFTTSTLTVPALTSLLTGLYPIDHGVRHNGVPGVSPDLELASELAFRKNMRTSFFSGGAPVFRKSGLNQGFEVFEDNLDPSFTYLHRPFRKTLEFFKTWIEKDVGDDSFFSVIYIPDLLFTNQITINADGDPRDQSYESQLNEIDVQLYDLVQFLQKKKRWNNTTVILVGLNGKTDEQRPKELAPLNLHSENTQVALYIKPAQKARDEAINWKIDQNVSLADVGESIKDLLGFSKELKANADFPVFSLSHAFKSSEPNWPEDRNILIESAWAYWRGAGPIKTAIINGHVLYINDDPPQLFNTLVDRFETNPLPLLQQSILKTTRKIQRSISTHSFPAFKPIPKERIAQLSIPFSVWTNPAQDRILLQRLKLLQDANPESLEIANWTAIIALRRKDWRLLKKLGDKQHSELWSYVADKNLKLDTPPLNDECFNLLNIQSPSADELKNCTDNLFLDFVNWIKATQRGLNKDQQRKKFEIAYRHYLIDMRIHRFNIANGFTWDIDKNMRFSPSRVELALSLPEYSTVQRQLFRSFFGDHFQ